MKQLKDRILDVADIDIKVKNMVKTERKEESK
jgi:hypothetical protein